MPADKDLWPLEATAPFESIEGKEDDVYRTLFEDDRDGEVFALTHSPF